jgi:hypothetical protein
MALLSILNHFIMLFTSDPKHQNVKNLKLHQPDYLVFSENTFYCFKTFSRKTTFERDLIQFLRGEITKSS